MDYQTVNYIYSGKNKIVSCSQIMKKKTLRQNKSQIATDCQHNGETKPHTVGLTKQKITLNTCRFPMHLKSVILTWSQK